jgi:hypothetical protein
MFGSIILLDALLGKMKVVILLSKYMVLLLIKTFVHTYI